MPCKHYHSPLDIIEIQCPCCDRFFPCHLCHEEIQGTPFQVWKEQDFEQLAILCTRCNNRCSIKDYLNNPSACPQCMAPFNPKCRSHWPLYWDIQC